MYGIVNKAVEGLITEEYGEVAWAKVKEKSGVGVEAFLSNEPYDDAITYQMVGAASEVLQIEADKILHALGEYWILKTGMQNYGSLMESGGDSLRSFLINLPNFHSRIMLMFPRLQPPEFLISDIEENHLSVHYFSHREGLQDFVKGLLSGLGKMYNITVEVEVLASKPDGADHDVFKVSW